MIGYENYQEGEFATSSAFFQSSKLLVLVPDNSTVQRHWVGPQGDCHWLH